MEVEPGGSALAALLPVRIRAPSTAPTAIAFAHRFRRGVPPCRHDGRAPFRTSILPHRQQTGGESTAPPAERFASPKASARWSSVASSGSGPAQSAARRRRLMTTRALSVSGMPASGGRRTGSPPRLGSTGAAWRRRGSSSSSLPWWRSRWSESRPPKARGPRRQHPDQHKRQRGQRPDRGMRGQEGGLDLLAPDRDDPVAEQEMRGPDRRGRGHDPQRTFVDQAFGCALRHQNPLRAHGEERDLDEDDA